MSRLALSSPIATDQSTLEHCAKIRGSVLSARTNAASRVQAPTRCATAVKLRMKLFVAATARSDCAPMVITASTAWPSGESGSLTMPSAKTPPDLAKATAAHRSGLAPTGRSREPGSCRAAVCTRKPRPARAGERPWAGLAAGRRDSPQSQRHYRATSGDGGQKMGGQPIETIDQRGQGRLETFELRRNQARHLGSLLFKDRRMRHRPANAGSHSARAPFPRNGCRAFHSASMRLSPPLCARAQPLKRR